MCGRFENKADEIELAKILNEMFQLDIIKESEFQKENIPPTLPVQTIFKNEGSLIISNTNWGIKFGDTAPLIFNSRIETIKEKPFWKTALEESRSLIPMTAFYEWKKLDNKKKQPYRIWLEGHKIFFVPAITIKLRGSQDYFTTLITTEPNEFIKDIHNRMPVIFTIDEIDKYFEMPIDILLEECHPCEHKMLMEPVEL